MTGPKRSRSVDYLTQGPLTLEWKQIIAELLPPLITN